MGLVENLNEEHGRLGGLSLEMHVLNLHGRDVFLGGHVLKERGFAQHGEAGFQHALLVFLGSMIDQNMGMAWPCT